MSPSCAAATARAASLRTRPLSASPSETWSSRPLSVISLRLPSTTVRAVLFYYSNLLFMLALTCRVCDSEALHQDCILRFLRHSLPCRPCPFARGSPQPCSSSPCQVEGRQEGQPCRRCRPGGCGSSCDCEVKLRIGIGHHSHICHPVRLHFTPTMYATHHCMLYAFSRRTKVGTKNAWLSPTSPTVHPCVRCLASRVGYRVEFLNYKKI